MIDLHTHTDCSDGTLSPAQLVRRAHQLELRAVAITDHDTVAGNPAAARAGEELGVEVIAGIEISTQWRNLTFHLLGYGVSRVGGSVADTLAFLVESRRERNPRMVERIVAVGRAMGREPATPEWTREALGL